jgi:hypothetical protein
MRFVLACVALVACSPATPQPTAAPAPTASVIASAAPTASASTNEVPVEMPANAAVKAPVFSDDDCTKTEDCTGFRTCHPDKCVAVANAGTMPAGMMCTMDCRGGTLDCNFNHCGCAKNAAGKLKCAMLPGAAGKH